MAKDEALLKAEVDKEHERWQDAEAAWVHMHEAEEKVFFHTLEIAKDGGLEEIGEREELWYKTRPVSACVLLLFIVYNVYYLLLVDLGILYTTANNNDVKKEDKEFLVTKTILDTVGVPITVKHATAWLAGTELMFLSGWILYTLFQCYLIKFKDGLTKWWAVSNLCWECLPQLSNLSAMKLLAYISPSKLSVDLFDILFYRESGVAVGLAWFLISRPFFIVFGIDCFLVKFRIASHFIESEDFNLKCFLGAFLFLNQILGALNLARELRFRLYRYVFGGEDGIVTDEERNIQHVWEGMITEKIFEKYPLWKACSLMLTWCDDDFQLLTLNQENFRVGS